MGDPTSTNQLFILQLPGSESYLRASGGYWPFQSWTLQDTKKKVMHVASDDGAKPPTAKYYTTAADLLPLVVGYVLVGRVRVAGSCPSKADPAIRG